MRVRNLRIAFVDEIQEYGVILSLTKALEERGHVIHRTGKLSHSVDQTSDPKEWVRLREAKKGLREFEPDAAILFRPQSWPVEYSADLRRNGVKIVPWFSDGPVLYKVGYFRALEESDFILHCGHADVIKFYEDLGTTPVGVNFPFWCEESPTQWSPSSVDESSPVFIGNVHDTVRRSRVEVLERIRPIPHLYGKISKPDRNRLKWKGIFDSSNALVSRATTHRFAVNIPQFYEEYRGSKFDFPSLKRLGGFQVPSRLVQYAALGIPTISLGNKQVEEGGLRGHLVAESSADFVEAASTISDSELNTIAREMSHDYRSYFTPRVRASFLEYLLTSEEWKGYSTSKRATLYRDFNGKSVVVSKRRRLTGPMELSSVFQFSRVLKGSNSKEVALFSSDWKSPGNELQVVRDSLRSAGREVREWGPATLSGAIISDPLHQFKGLISTHLAGIGMLRRVESVILVGAEYGLTPKLWEMLRSRAIQVACIADPTGVNSPIRARLAARADQSTTIRLDVAERALALGLENHRFASLDGGAPRRTRLEFSGRTELLELLPLAPKEIRILEGTDALSGWEIVILSLSYLDFPGRARQVLRLSAYAGCAVVIPRSLLSCLAIRPIAGIYSYEDRDELALQLEHAASRSIDPAYWEAIA